MKMCIA